MSMKFTQLQCKEVICISDGRRLGFVADVLVEIPGGQVNALVVPGQGKMFGLGNPREEFIIPWDTIRKIGPDIILVDTRPEDCRCSRKKGSLPWGGKA